MRLLQPRLDGLSQCHLSWAQNNQGAGDLELGNQRAEGAVWEVGGGGRDQKDRVCCWPSKVLTRMLHPPPSASSQHTLCFSVRPGTHTQSRPPQSSAPLRSCGCPGKSHGAASIMEKSGSFAGRTLGSLGSAVERDTNKVRSCLVPSALVTSSPYPSCLPAGPAGLAGAPLCTKAWVSSSLSGTSPGGRTHLPW